MTESASSCCGALAVVQVGYCREARKARSEAGNPERIGTAPDDRSSDGCELIDRERIGERTRVYESDGELPQGAGQQRSST